MTLLDETRVECEGATFGGVWERGRGVTDIFGGLCDDQEVFVNKLSNGAGIRLKGTQIQSQLFSVVST